MPIRRLFFAAAMAAVLLGCDAPDPAADAAAASRPANAAPVAPEKIPADATGAGAVHAEAPAGVAWFAGDVEAAFERARADGKPVFLYWGAEWCPYCADLEAHVFTRRDFVEKLSLFVPVYLDGDDTGAQKWGETLGIAGYPTVLVLGPDREELARIAGGMDLALYTEMLDLVLGDVRPLDELLGKLAAGSSRLSAEDCRRLAYNGWALEDSTPDSALRMAVILERAAELCPEPARIERARLTAIAASYAVEAESDRVAAGSTASVRLLRLLAGVHDIVADTSLSAAIADALQYLGADYFELARDSSPRAAAELARNWTAAMDAASADPRYGAGDRLAAVRSKVEAVKALTPSRAVPPELAAEANELIDASLAAAGSSPARPGVVNSAVNLLIALDQPERAKSIAADEMQRSKTPYYYMADLAALEEMMGRNDEAIRWLERAYHSSHGTATRFQWGTNYVVGLLRLDPANEKAIRAAAVEVLGELAAPDRIYRRTRARLETLDARLRDWNAGGEHAGAIDEIRRVMDGICAGIPEHEAAALESCRRFLSAPDA